jgi:hypothetical protein
MRWHGWEKIMNKSFGVAMVGFCSVGLIAAPAHAGKQDSPAYYKTVRAATSGTYTFTEQTSYDQGGGETETYTVEFSGRGAKLYLGAGDAYGWRKAARGTVAITYSISGSIPAVSWNPCTGSDWQGSGTLNADVKVGLGGPTRDFGKGGSGRKVKLRDKTVLVSVEGSVPVTTTTNRKDDYGGCQTETETQSSTVYVRADMRGKVKGSKVRLLPTKPEDPGVDNITRTVAGSGNVSFSRNPALRW